MLLTELTFASSALFVGTKAYNKRQRKKQISQFLEEPKPHNQRNGVVYVGQWFNGTSQFGAEAETFWTLTRKKLATLKGKRVRDQYLREISSDGASPEVSEAEKKANRNLAVSIGSLGVAVSSIFVTAPLGILCAPAIIYTMTPVYKKSYSMLKKGQVGVDTLSAITIVGCLSLGYFVVGSTLTMVYCISSKLLLKVQNNSRKNLIDVFRQQPRSVWVYVDGVEVELPFEQLKVGDTVVVDTGSTIPADGVISRGVASIDQHILTGEAQPAEKGAGDQIFASTVVLSGRIYFEVQQAGADTTAAKIGEILNNTSDFKSATQLQAEVVADRTAVPTLLVSAAALPLVGPYSALAALNAHFKHRMGIVAPIGIMNFLNLASQRGVLIKDGRTLDLLNQVDTIVFDKTGTLTKEQPYIEAIHAYAAYNEADVLTFAAAAETKQTHPIARAILHEAERRQLTLPHIDEAEYKVGYGLSVVMDHQLVQVGSARFMEMTDITISAATTDTLEFCQEQGHSVVLVAVDNTLVGAIELRPTLRPEAKEVIARLKKRRHIKSIYIISGDHETPTRKLAQDLGIDHYFAQTLPEKKAELIEQLQDEGKFICYIGDGINDSIALKKSQVSVSLRGASTVATDTAQIVLMDESLNQFVDLFDLAKDFKGNMRAGFICLLIPTVIGMGGAFFLQFGMLQTLILTTGGLIAGVANSMLPLLKRKEPAPAFEVEHWPVPPQVSSGSEQTALESETSMHPEKGGQTDFESLVEDDNHVGLVGSSRLSAGDTGRWQSG